MISVAAAKNILRRQVSRLPPVSVPLHQAGSLILAADVYAPADVPCFDQSAMDGYAFSYHSWQQQALPVIASIPAGNALSVSLLPRQATRIYTGAAVPAGADTVVMQEKTDFRDGLLTITDAQLRAGGNIRSRGSEITRDSLALAKDSYLTAGAIGFLANMGIANVPVYRKPVVSIIITGNELQQPGQPLMHGQVYEANSYMLITALQQLPVTISQVYYVTDHLEQTVETIQSALSHADLILLTGGVSTGDYDFVAPALAQCGIEPLFHKVKQKPAKPLLAAQKGQQIVIGLPGNPASVLTCFYEYVVPVIEQMMGQTTSRIREEQRLLSTAVTKKAGVTHFMKATCDATTVTPTGAQESYRLSAFATANCLLALEEEAIYYAAGSMVTVHLLPIFIQ